jgi:adenosylhomocysteine nucleosidase
MSVEGRVAAQPVAIIVALGLEHVSLRRQALRSPPAGWIVTQSGPGHECAARAAAAALAAGAQALVSWGLAGGLAAGLDPGTVVLPRCVRVPGGETFACDPEWHGRLAAQLRAGFVVSCGDLVTVPAALGSPAAKRAAAAATGAVAADMESAAIAAVAARAGAPFVAIRVVVDALADALPPGVERWIDERGNQRFGAALGAALQPGQWPALWTLAKRFRVARAVLERLARVANHLFAAVHAPAA